MLCRNCFREIPDGTKFCPECGAPTEASVNAAGGNPNDLSNLPPLEPGTYERHTMGPDMWQDDQVVSQQSQYQQGQFQQGQYQQGQFQQGQYPPQGQMPPFQGSYNQVPPPAKPKQSGMSTAAMILGILTCTAILGFIIGLIDLIKNKDDGNKHGGSIFAVVWGGIILLATISNAVRLGHDRNTSNTRTAVESTQSDSDYSADSYDTAPATDDSSRSTDDSYSDSQNTDSIQDQQSSDPGVVDPQLKAMLDSYEEFIDEYIKFLKTYTNSNDPMAMLSEYTTYMTKYSDLMQKISELDSKQDQMSQADRAYYIDWNARIQKKLLEVSNFN